jgi:gliding motility-associated-like protein
MIKFFKSFLLIFISIQCFGQAFDNCNSAYLISDPSNYCSGKNEFTLVGTTPSGFINSNCYPISAPVTDIWFKFVASKIAANVLISGKSIGNTLSNPQATFYTGDCSGTIKEIFCGVDQANNGALEFTINNLVIGETYYIRISDRNNRAGNFQLCVTNFNPPVLAGQDCISAAVLCDKSSFVVNSLTGSGAIPDEGVNTCLDPPGVGVSSENRSTWYKWTAANSGTLTFDIIALNPDDDIDFVLFELNSLTNCTSKSAIRCVATFNVNDGINPCAGVGTGLRLGENDLQEDIGCELGQNNYVRAVTMVAGRSYGLLINNDSKTGVAGFKISFGGTGVFAGPSAVFNAIPDPNCGSKFNVAYVNAGVTGEKYEWDFGKDASIKTANSIGPFNIEYSTPGEKSIILKVTSPNGCVVTNIVKVNAVSCCTNADLPKIDAEGNPPLCNGTSTGKIKLKIKGTNPPFQISVNNGPFTSDTIRTMIPAGRYVVRVKSALNCIDSTLVILPDPPKLVVNAGSDQNINFPDSFALLANYNPVDAGDVIKWSPDGKLANPQNLSTKGLTDITQDYVFTVTTSNGCQASDTVRINVKVDCANLQAPKLQLIAMDPSCPKISDGSILAIGSGLYPPFTYSVANGPFLRDSVFSKLNFGNYKITVKDSRGCTKVDSTNLLVPQSISLNAGLDQVVNFPDTFELKASYNPLNPGDSIGWSPAIKLLNPTSLNTKGFTDTDQNFILLVKNSNGCIFRDTVKITVKVDCANLQAPKLQLIQKDPSCPQINDGSITVKATGLYSPFMYAIANGTFQQDSVFAKLPSGKYKITLKDGKGCTQVDSIELLAPQSLSVDAGLDKSIILGDSIMLVGDYDPQELTDVIRWTPSIGVEDSSSLKTIAVPQGNTRYILSIKTIDNCTFSDTLLVTTTKPKEFFAPNIFNPNGLKEVNKTFKLTTSKSVKSLSSMDIYDRWGNKVYHTENELVPSGWNGKFNGVDAPTGVYIWIAKLVLLDSEIKTFSGSITLIR